MTRPRGSGLPSPALRALLAALLLAFPACRPSGRPRVFANAPVVVIVVDTLRADRLPAYGYKGVETPALDALARDSVVFDNAVSQVPLTLPSHATLFTGLPPFAHGVRDNVGYRLDPAHETLAHLLRARGYATGAAVSAAVLDHGTGIGEGFDFYDDAIESRAAGEAIGRVQRPGGRTRERLEAWIAAQPPGRPFFAFLHLYEPHAPYAPPEPFRSSYAGRPYDGEVACADRIVGDFVGALRARGLYEKALVVFLSDHGESLGAHGEDEHGIFLYRETTRVPLFLKLPGGALAGRRCPAPAQVADVFPTVAALVGADDGRSRYGVSLAELAEHPRNRRIYSESLYPRLHFGWSDLASLTDDRYQYVGAPRSELYDFRADPEERHDLAAGLPPAFRSMRTELSAMDRPLQPPGASDPETLKKLAALGYLGGASPRAMEKDLPDPKDRIGILDALKTAGTLLEARREDEAVALLRRVGDEEPGMVDVWETLAMALRRMGRPADARDALLRADRLSPATAPILLGLASVSVEAKDFDAARRYAEAARAAGAPDVHAELAAAASGAGDVATARREAEAARQARPSAQGPLVQLARIEQQAGNLPLALQRADDAVALGEKAGATVENAQAVRADILAHLGREAEAEAAFRAEVRDHPDNLDAWQRLALLHASGGRPAEYRAVLEELYARVPSARACAAAARVCEIVGDASAAREWRRRREALLRRSA